MKKSIIAAAILAGASLPALASQYFVVVPVPNRTATASQNINVALTGYSLPGGLLGQPFAGFDFKRLLSVTGDSNFTGYGVHWSVVGGSLPAGLALNADGTLSGTPTAAGSSSFQVMASYKSKAGQQSYQVVVANLTVALATAAPPQALVGQAYNYDLKPLLTVSGDSAYAGNGAGVSWSVVSSTLPAGLYLTSDGWIGGTPTAGGTGSITARATYKGINGQQTYQVVTIDISVALAADAAMPAGVQGAQYSYDLKTRLSVTGDPAYTPAQVSWSLASGTLPAGLQLNADGTITGTPTAEGTYPFSVQASYRSKSGQQTYQVVVGAITVALGSATLPAGEQGAAYSFDLKPSLAVTGDAAYAGSGVTWSVVSGSLPAGLSLSADGVIAGTPTAASTGTPFTVQAAYKTKTGQQNYSVLVGAITVTLGSATLPAGEQGAAYSFDLKPKLAVSGDAAYSGSGITWSVVSGSLPAGLSLGADGVISGMPTAANSGTPFTVQAAYKTTSGQQNYSVLVAAITVSLAGATIPTMTAGTPAVYDLKPNLSIAGDAAYAGNGTGVTWNLSGSLPGGLSLGTDGRITGTPSTLGSSSVTVTASYKNAISPPATYSTLVQANIVTSGATRKWSDGTYAKSCKAYRNPTGNYLYSGSTGDGTYRIQPGSTPMDVYCDQTTDGGGWTLVTKADWKGMFPQTVGEGTATVCSSLTDTCLTNGTSNVYVGTTSQPTDYMFLMSANGFAHIHDTQFLLHSPANYVRDNVASPGHTLYSLMTDSTPGWHDPADTATDPSDQNKYVFADANGLAWSDGNWHGCPANASLCSGLVYPNEEGLQVFPATQEGAALGQRWGQHHFVGEPTLSGGVYTLQPYTYLGIVGTPDNYGTTRTVPQATFEAYRWAIFVR